MLSSQSELVQGSPKIFGYELKTIKSRKQIDIVFLNNMTSFIPNDQIFNLEGEAETGEQDANNYKVRKTVLR